ncbi:MAG TPA: acyl-CoA dehydrogenase family protein [Herpetosiphonaceae bacterium]|nr:acyl-CoA dehydrogenase family protein [Herpetosiphonaceae bacterium]
MDFELSATHKEVRERARQFAREIVAPRAAEIDARGTYPHEIFAALRDAGLLSLSFAPEYGGSGVGTLGLALATEEVGKYCQSSALMLLLTRLSTAAIMLSGTEEQKQRYGRGVASGKLKGAFALTEPQAGSDAAAITTTACRDGDAWVLHGQKRWAGQATEADFCIVVAKIDAEASGERGDGVGIFIVDLPNPGFRITREMPKMGVTAVPVVDIALEDCRVHDANVVGDTSRGFKLTMQGLNVVRPIVAARGVGLAQGAVQYAVDYTQERHTFGRPVIDHQAVGFSLAEMAMKIEAARLLTYQACLLVDSGKSDVTIAPYLSMAKAFATEVAVEAADRALQALGGNGYLKDYATERYYRDAKQLMLVEGTSEIHRLIIHRALKDGRLSYW